MALTCNIFTELASTMKYGKGGCYITLFSPSCHLKRFPVTSPRFTELFVDNINWKNSDIFSHLVYIPPFEKIQGKSRNPIRYGVLPILSIKHNLK